VSSPHPQAGVANMQTIKGPGLFIAQFVDADARLGALEGAREGAEPIRRLIRVTESAFDAPMKAAPPIDQIRSMPGMAKEPGK
jgi:hypothetical protein